MDAHVALELADRRARIDGFDERMHGLVAAGAEERRAEDAPARLLDVNLEEAPRLAFLDRARDARHGTLPDHGLYALVPDFFFRNANPAEPRRCRAVAP